MRNAVPVDLKSSKGSGKLKRPPHQLAKINNNTATVLKSIALGGRKKDGKDGNLGDNKYLPQEGWSVMSMDCVLWAGTDDRTREKSLSLAGCVCTTNIMGISVS
jgi:hypothetical protein